MKLETFKFDIDSDGIGHAIFDVPGRSMNTLTAQAVADIIAITKEVASNDKIKGLVISSGKASGFCAGADLGEMNERAGGGEKKKLSEAELKAQQFEQGFSLNRTLRELETCGKPVAVALNGLALGGGLEVALAGHYRVAANDNPKIQIAAYYYPWYTPSHPWDQGYLRQNLLPPHQPFLGEYNQQDSAIVDQQVQWANQYGISQFISSWYVRYRY